MVTKRDLHPALILIGLQIGVVSLPTAQPAQELVKNSSGLAEAFLRA